MPGMFLITLTISATFYIHTASTVELTFELPDNEKQCYYEDIQQGVKSTIEFQVLSGGNYDVDVLLESPTGNVLYRGLRRQYDTYYWTADLTGEHKLCFSNEFSTLTHKVVYFDFIVGEDEKPLPHIDHHLEQVTELTDKLGNSSINVHESLNAIIAYQTHHRLMETLSRKRVGDLNACVSYWSMMETIIILFIGIGQIIVLRNFFNEKR